MTPAQIVAHIAVVSEAWASAAGVGAMETAGSIISFLAAHPEHVADFMDGKTTMLDWPIGWHEQGKLSWHGQDGKIYRPEHARRHRLIKQMEKRP